ncbi:MAG: amidase, partial [Rubellimicrobium sp.]|nr:amidase [Rubellimicrobium sp.]
HGPTLNPWDPTRTPGGSSGGAAAAVAAGMLPMAHASDSGGSIRVPAACCGVFGYKPSAGLVATGAAIGPLVGGFNCDHVVTRSVRDSAAMLDATAAPERPFKATSPVPDGYLATLDTAPPRLRIGLVTTSPAGHVVQPEIARALERAAKLLAGLGHEILPFDWPEGVAPGDSADPLWTAEIALMVDQRAAVLGRAPAPGELGPVIEEALRIAGAMTIREAAHRRLRRWEIRRLMDHAMTGCDVILSPVTSEVPLPSGLLSGLAQQDLSAWGARTGAFAPHTEIFNLTGQPAMSLPLDHDDDGLPIGVQLAGRLGADRLMLQLAREVEQALPWAGRWPKGL